MGGWGEEVFGYGCSTYVLDPLFFEIHIILKSSKAFDKTPYHLSNSTAAIRSDISSAIGIYNSLITRTLTSFQSLHPESSFTFVNTTGVFLEALANPEKYGAGKDGATCLNVDGKSCLWWDFFHPGLAIQRGMAEEVVRALKGVFF